MNIDTGMLAICSTVIAISIAIMQMLKYADTNNVFKRFYPLASFIIGLIIAGFFHLALVIAIMTALAIAGVYDGWKFTIAGQTTNTTLDTVPTEPSVSTAAPTSPSVPTSV